MSDQLLTCLIAVAANLAGMLVIHSFMAFCLTRLAWRGRGMFGVVVTIVVAQMFWIALALLIVGSRDPDSATPYALWFGNWLVCGFAVVLLWQSARRIPRRLEDSARLDGLGLLGMCRHVLFPFVRRDLALLAFFTVMATLLPFWGLVTLPDAGSSIVLFQRASPVGERIGLMIVGSLVGTLPAIAIFFSKERQAQ